MLRIGDNSFPQRMQLFSQSEISLAPLQGQRRQHIAWTQNLLQHQPLPPCPQLCVPSRSDWADSSSPSVGLDIMSSGKASLTVCPQGEGSVSLLLTPMSCIISFQHLALVIFSFSLNRWTMYATMNFHPWCVRGRLSVRAWGGSVTYWGPMIFWEVGMCDLIHSPQETCEEGGRSLSQTQRN